MVELIISFLENRKPNILLASAYIIIIIIMNYSTPYIVEVNPNPDPTNLNVNYYVVPENHTMLSSTSPKGNNTSQCAQAMELTKPVQPASVSNTESVNLSTNNGTDMRTTFLTESQFYIKFLDKCTESSCNVYLTDNLGGYNESEPYFTLTLNNTLGDTYSCKVENTDVTVKCGIKYYEVVVGSEKYKISDKNCCKGTYSITSSSGKGMTAAVYSGCCDSDIIKIDENGSYGYLSFDDSMSGFEGVVVLGPDIRSNFDPLARRMIYIGMFILHLNAIRGMTNLAAVSYVCSQYTWMPTNNTI